MFVRLHIYVFKQMVPYFPRH